MVLPQWISLNAAVLLFGVPAVCYLAQGIMYYVEQNRWGMAFALYSYAQANVGLILDYYKV